jgi:hypothetical protein
MTTTKPDLAAARAEVEKLTATVRQVEQEMREADMQPTGSYSNNAPDGMTTHARIVKRWADTLREALKEQ